MKKLVLFTVISLILNSAFLIHNCFAQWQPDVRLTNDTARSYTSYNNARCIASSGNNVHVVWFDTRDGNYEIYYKRSSDSGVNWGTDTRLTNNGAESWSPSIALSGTVVHVVWYDYRDGNAEIYYKHSTDSGVSWEADIRLTNTSITSAQPSVAVSGPDVQIVWVEAPNGPFPNLEIYYKRSTDSGINWGTDTRLTNNGAESWSPSIALSGTVVHVVWYDMRDGYPNDEIYYKRSTDAGLTWGADTRLTNNPAYSFHPTVAVTGLNVNVVWQDYRDYMNNSNSEIYYKRSTDSGISWGADTRLTNNDTWHSSFPSISVSGTLVHVVWRDDRDGISEIYYKRSTDWGLNWGADTRLTNKNAASNFPSIAVSGSVVHVVWEDSRDGNWEIYYKRNPTGNIIGIKNITSEIPSSYSLEQNYPNPFNPTTKIKFQIPSNSVGQTFLSVYDLLGKEVTTLVNEQLAPGTYEVTFDASMLTSGIYFYRLETTDFVQTNKMILLK